MPFSAELDTARDAARAAAAIIRPAVGQARSVRHKGAHDLVTEIDVAAERAILEHLNRAFPDYEVMAEESFSGSAPQTRPSRPRWIVDPLDGTTNFTHGVPPYCTSIALQDVTGELVVGVILEISLGEMFSASTGEGAYLGDERLSVSDTSELENALLTTGFPFREFWYVDEYLRVLERLIGSTRGLRRPGSAAADLAYVAAGRFDGFFEAGLAPWDVAAGIVLVREAGGHVTGLLPEADPLMTGQILATNSHLYDRLLPYMGDLGEAYRRGA